MAISNAGGWGKQSTEVYAHATGNTAKTQKPAPLVRRAPWQQSLFNSKWVKKGIKKLCAALFHLLWSAKQNREKMRSCTGVQVLNRKSGLEGGMGGGVSLVSSFFFFKGMLKIHPLLPPSTSEGTFSRVKHASNRTCKHPRWTHLKALIIGSNQMNYWWPVWWIIQPYILSSDINIPFFLFALRYEYLCLNVSIRGIYPPLIRSYVIFWIKLHKLQTFFLLWVVAEASVRASL